MEQKGIKTAELEQLYAALAIPVVVAKPTIRRPNITSQHFPIASVVTEYKHADSRSKRSYPGQSTETSRVD